jgi:DnaK suppressor protein
MLREKEKKARMAEKAVSRSSDKEAHGHNVHGLNGYRPTDKEPFMNERQRDYFRAKLLTWKDEILKEARDTLQHLQDENVNHPDLADRASSEKPARSRLCRSRRRNATSGANGFIGTSKAPTSGFDLKRPGMSRPFSFHTPTSS